MRGHIRPTGTERNGKTGWDLIFPIGMRANKNGKRVPRYKWTRFYGSRQEADARVAELITEFNHNVYVEPTKLTLGAWLDTWRDTTLRGRCRDSTFTCWKGIIENHLKPALGDITLQRLD